MNHAGSVFLVPMALMVGPGGPCGREPDLWDSQIGLGCKSYPRC